VVAAINPQTALLDLLGEDRLEPGLRARLRSRHRSNAVQFVVHAALSRLPPWPGAPLDVYNGMQSLGASVEQFAQNFREAEAGIAPRDPAAYLFTLSALDPTLAPEGGHTAYIACASYPARFADGGAWEQRGEAEAHRLVAAVERRAPGFTSSVMGLAWRHADDWARETGLLGGHPMHLDMSLDQLGLFRPLLELAGHRAPLPGLYLSGAGTAPTGGVSAVPGRAAARAVLRDRQALRPFKR
jgi:phytoene dehydrogenase-like protein